MWDYGSLSEDQEREYINAKMRMRNRQMPDLEVEGCELWNVWQVASVVLHIRTSSCTTFLFLFMQVASLTELIMTSQNLMRDYAFRQFSSGGLDENMAKLSSRSCVSQRDIQRVFTFYQWLMDSYTRYKPYETRPDYSRRAVLVALGIVYYMRLNNQYRKDYKEYLDKEVRVGNEVSFSEVGIKQLVLLCNVFTWLSALCNQSKYAT